MKNLMIVLCMFITQASCQTKHGTTPSMVIKYSKTPSGLEYKLFTGKGGTRLSAAKFVKYNIQFTIERNGKDSVLGSTYSKIPLFAPIDTTSSPKRPYTYLEILPKCKVGDSIEFYLSIDTLKTHNADLPPGIFPDGGLITGKMKILHAYNTLTEEKADIQYNQASDANTSNGLSGAVSRVDVKNQEIAVVPWDKEKKIWDEEHPSIFKFTIQTKIEGETNATAGELKAGTKIVESFHLTGVSSEGLSGTKFEIKNMSQILHRRVTIHWDADSNLTKIELPYLFGGESMPGMGGNSGFSGTLDSDDVIVKDLSSKK